MIHPLRSDLILFTIPARAKRKWIETLKRISDEEDELIKFLHTRLRVSDLDRSVHFYSKYLGFQVLRRKDKSHSGNHIVLLELPGNTHQLELTWSADYKLKVPEDLMHLAIGVPDLISFCNQLESVGIEIWPNGWREKFISGKKMAFIDDPDGYEIELLEEDPKAFLSS